MEHIHDDGDNIVSEEDYKTTLKYCVDLINSDKPKDYVRRTLHFLFSLKVNFPVFCKLCLPHAFNKPFGDFHIEIIDEFWKSGNSVLACPRGHGKSTLVGQGKVLHDICYKKEKYILYVSLNTEKSNQFLEPISYELKNNMLLKFIYPNINLKKVKNKDTGKDRSDCFDIGREMRVQAFSFEKNARGFKFNNQRPTLIVFDDIDDDDRVMNPVLRHKDYMKFSKQVIPALDSLIGKYKMIGTIIHLDSLLRKQLNSVGGRVYEAYQTDKDNKIIPESILFPELFSVKFFEKYIAKFGSMAASSEYLNNPIDDVTNLIKRAWIQSCFDENFSFKDNMDKYDIKLQGVDFAFSDRITADKSAFVGIGKNANCIDLISYFEKQGMSIIQQLDYIEYLSGIHGFTDNGLEENSIRSMSTEIKNYNFKYTLFWVGANDAAAVEKDWKVAEYENKRHTIGKENMIRRLAVFFENNYNSITEGEGYTFRIPYKDQADRDIAHNLMEQCCSFSLADGKLVEAGVHPDSPIALQLALEVLKLGDYDYEVDIAW